MPSSFPTPERCLLVQAAHWFIDGTMPIPDEFYLRAPIKLKAENSELRGLFVALLAEDCDLRGDLVVQFRQYKETQSFEETENAPPPLPTASLAQDVKILRDGLSLRNVKFELNETAPTIGISGEYDKGQFDKLSQKYPKHEDWTAIFNFKKLTVDFSKLSTFLSRTKESTLPPAKLGAPSKYKWDLIWAEIAVRADLDNLPSTQAECIRDISQWYVDQFGDAPPQRIYAQGQAEARLSPPPQGR